MVKWVVRIGLQEEENQSHDHITDIKHRFPIGTQNVQTDIALNIDVWMIDICVTVYDRRFVGILRWHSNGEVELSTNP